MISQKQFCQWMHEIKISFDSDHRRTKALQEFLGDTSITGYDNYRLYKISILMLATIMNDKDDFIDYFIYELDFGRNCKKHQIKVNNKEITLEDSKSLYNFLITYYN